MTTTARHLRPFLAKEWRALGGATVMTGLLTVAELAKPWPMKLVIDDLFADRDGAFALSPHDYRVLAAIALLILGIALVDAVATYYSDLWLQSARCDSTCAGRRATSSRA
jgi:ATP-binding cassette subfamily B protein